MARKKKEDAGKKAKSRKAAKTVKVAKKVAKQGSGRAGRAGRAVAPKSDLGQLRNIGRTIEQRLQAVDVTSEKQLRKVGAVKAFQRICAAFPQASIPVCYYLYSLQGALMNCHWDALPEETKQRLRRRAGVKPRR